MSTEDRAHQLLRKVPEVTLWFWVIKVLCTTVGETFADFLGTNLHLGLTGTTAVMVPFLLVALFFQFRAKRYVAGIYWLAVVLISVVGTLVTDNMVENLGVTLTTSTIIFAIALGVTFLIWNASEKTLSIHSIYTRKREAFYWCAILFTFALGTAAGDLVAEKLAVGYLISALIFAAIIGASAIGYFYFKLNGVLAFWIAYIVTRPLGASIGDLLSQPRHPTAAYAAQGNFPGLGLGTTVTSFIFLGAILAVVIYLSVSKTDVEELSDDHLREQADEMELLRAAADALGSGERILAAGVFHAQADHHAAMVSGVASSNGHGSSGSSNGLGQRTAGAPDEGSVASMLVAITPKYFHVLEWDGAGTMARSFMDFNRGSTAVQVTMFGTSRHINLVDMDSDKKIGLVGAAAFSPEATGDRLVVHLLNEQLENE